MEKWCTTALENNSEGVPLINDWWCGGSDSEKSFANHGAKIEPKTLFEIREVAVMMCTSRRYKMTFVICR